MVLCVSTVLGLILDDWYGTILDDHLDDKKTLRESCIELKRRQGIEIRDTNVKWVHPF